MEKWIFLVIGGALGTLSRYGLSGVVSQKFGVLFPWGTLAVNLTGCFVVGFLDVLFERKFLMGPGIRVFLLAGFCAAFTTFSTLILETANLLKDNQFLYAFGNVMGSVCVGLLAFKLGMVLAELI